MQRENIHQREVARAAGVSRATVSMVFNGTAEKYRISKSTINRVLKAGNKLKYSKNVYASSLKIGKSNLIGVFGFIAAASIRQIRQNIMAGYIKGRKYNVIMEDLYWTKDPGSVLTEIASFMPEGLIICDLESRSMNRAINFLHNKGIPIVLVDAYAEKNYDNIRIDRELVGFLSTSHLLEQGCNEVYYTLPQDIHLMESYHTWTVSCRYRGFKKALSQADKNIKAEDYLIYLPREIMGFGDSNYKWGYMVGKKFLEKKRNFPVGIVSTNDQVAIGIVKALLEGKVRIPEDVAVVGSENLPESEYSLIPLSTIAFPIDIVAQKACETLLQKIKGEKTPKVTVNVDPALIVRASSSRLKRDKAGIDSSIPAGSDYRCSVELPEGAGS